jgi:multidrug resistance efflux pump
MLKRLIPLVVILAIGGGVYWYSTRPVTSLTLTGTVTTNEIVVSPQIGGRIEKLLVNEGDTVTKDELVAVLTPAELQQERAYYDASVAGAGSQVAESEAALRLQERQTTDQIKQAQATLAATEAQHQAAQAQLEDARIALDRQQRMMKDGVGTQEQLDRARTAHDVARSQLAALAKQVDAQKSAVALAESSAEQVAVRRSQVRANQQQRAAVVAQRAKADVRLAYTELHAPIAGIVDVRVALPGEVVNPGDPVITLVNPDDLWVRADVEETYIDRIRVGDKMKIRLPSGDEVVGEVFYRRVDAGFATQRDVSRTKRDIKTFEIRLKVDNKDRRLAVGMTTYVELPLNQPRPTARPEGGQSNAAPARQSLLAHVAEPRRQ